MRVPRAAQTKHCKCYCSSQVPFELPKKKAAAKEGKQAAKGHMEL